MRIQSAAALFLALLICTSASADPVTVVFTGVNGAHDNHYYVSPYFGTINGHPATLFCIDLGNTVHINQSWLANLSTITPGSDLSLTRFGSLPNALALYQQAAWLVSQFPAHTNDYVNLQYALWNLFNSAAPDTPASNAWLAQAAANYSHMSFWGFRVVTNIPPVTLTGSGQVQEFITLVPTPEPASLALFGTGLIGVATIVRRRHLSRERKNSGLRAPRHPGQA